MENIIIFLAKKYKNLMCPQVKCCYRECAGCRTVLCMTNYDKILPNIDNIDLRYQLYHVSRGS